MVEAMSAGQGGLICSACGATYPFGWSHNCPSRATTKIEFEFGPCDMLIIEHPERLPIESIEHIRASVEKILNTPTRPVCLVLTDGAAAKVLHRPTVVNEEAKPPLSWPIDPSIVRPKQPGEMS